jgi:hypothetical protein
MTSAQIWLAAVSPLLGLLAWDNWQMRSDLAQLRQVNAAQANVISARAAAPPETPRVNCPANPVATTTDKGLPTASPAADNTSGPIHNTSTVVIPPGTNLLEALKIVQREQAKNPPPSSATVNPFSTNN